MNWFRCLIVFASLVLGVGQSAPAQHNWLRPGKYFYEVGDSAEITFATGDDFIAKAYHPDPKDIISFDYESKSGTADLRNLIGDSSTAVKIPLTTEGYHGLILKTINRNNVSAEEFNSFLQFYGMDLYNERRKKNLLTKPAVVTVNKVTQVAIRVGKDNGSGWSQLRGLPIEVIPDKNPETLKRGDRIAFTVYENGSPAFGVQVKILNRWNKRTTIQNIYTEKNGVVSTTVSNPGDWMVTVMKMRNAAKPDEYDVDLFTLNFGYR